MSKPTLNHVSVKCSQIKKHCRNVSIVGVGSPVHGFSNFGSTTHFKEVFLCDPLGG